MSYKPLPPGLHIDTLANLAKLLKVHLTQCFRGYHSGQARGFVGGLECSVEVQFGADGGLASKLFLGVQIGVW